MLKIDRTKKSFSALETPTLRQAGILERTDLQACILNSSTEFFGELGMDLFTVGQEIRPSQDVDDRIDVLAIDREGAVVVVELKRGDNKPQMLQPSLTQAWLLGGRQTSSKRCYRRRSGNSSRSSWTSTSPN